MQHILIYSDSLSWGLIPGTRKRLPFEQRWPGVLEGVLIKSGLNIRVIENCLNGRRTTWNDPFKPGRDGSIGLAQVIEMHSPLKLIILMLGTNDFQATHSNDAYLSAQGMSKLVQIIKLSPIEPGMPEPDIMIVAPPGFLEPKGSIASKFIGAQQRSIGLSAELAKVADEHSTLYFDASGVVEASKIDGVHLDENQHSLLGTTIAAMIAKEKII